MYNQVIGPEENSKKAMKTMTKVTDGMVYGLLEPSLGSSQYAYFKLKKPTKKRTTAIPKLPMIMIVLLPNLNRRNKPPNVAKKLTTPTMNVIISGEIPPRLENMVFE